MQSSLTVQCLLFLHDLVLPDQLQHGGHSQFSGRLREALLKRQHTGDCFYAPLSSFFLCMSYKDGTEHASGIATDCGEQREVAQANKFHAY